MNSTASLHVVNCVCRNCGQPMDVQPQRTITGGWTQMLTCPANRQACFMGGQTLDARDYFEMDLTPYQSLKGINPMPDGFVPATPRIDEYNDADTLEATARALFATRHSLTSADVETLLVTNPDPAAQMEIDSIMDEIAVDHLEDSTTWAGFDADNITWSDVDPGSVAQPVQVFDVDAWSHRSVAQYTFCYAPPVVR